MFNRVLIANRGEIAVRVIRTLRAMGIDSVAVYSEADAGAPHVRAADVAIEIGPANATESYLNIPRVIEAAKEAGADAIHPGYGFLAENAAFVRACDKAGITFIGPSAESMEAVGDKAAARTLAAKAGVPTVPGTDGALDDPKEIRVAAEGVGFPLLLKAAAGGGGKGMRRVDAVEELDGAIDGAQREGKNSFGDSRLIVERYFHPARHIEVQVVGDGQGGAIAVGERECSLQRRHQKILEETPSAAISEETRQALFDAARKLAAAVNYAGAGTAEFLVDEEGGYYFLEMNTRLQVEHPVSEWVSGLDLVQMQLEVAAGQGLTVTQDDIQLRGHSIEVRLYAENPSDGFLPTAGTVLHLYWPRHPGVRIDTGLEEGMSVGVHYDPMIAKVIAGGPDRDSARRRLIAALKEIRVLGLVTNQSFLIDLLESELFVSAVTFTHSVDGWNAERDEPTPTTAAWVAAMTATGGAARTGSSATDAAGDTYNPWQSIGHWRVLS